jgi:LPXTG-site transpeptidase (sortase) family protein
MASIVRRSFTLLSIAVFIASVWANAFPIAAFAQGSPSSESAVRPAPSLAAAPAISLGGLGDILIGEDFSFSISFKNTGSNPGYGPFVDLVLPTNGADGDYNRAVQDGVEFVSASVIGYKFSEAQATLFEQKFPGSGGITCMSHPWARQQNGQYVQVCGPAGDTFVSMRLPLGAFAQGQPSITVAVKAKLSNLADLDTTLNFRVRGGFLYGNDSLDNWCCGDLPIFTHPSSQSVSWLPGPVTPKVITFEKMYSGPDNIQDETSSGPNFTRQYTLTGNIATGQTLTRLEIFDKLPQNEQFVSVDAGATTPGYAIISTPSLTVPGGTLGLRYGSVTGALSDVDVQVVFNFYVPRLDSGGASVINPVSGDVALSRNIAWLTGDWTPGDARDKAQSVASDIKCVPGGNCEPLHTLEDKSIAIQKSVTDLTDGNPSPGDVFEYSLVFQVSDYFAFSGISVTDLISDGQHVLSSFTPTLQISGNGYTLATAALGAANYDISCNYSGGPGPECKTNNPAADDGTTRLTFRVSPEIIARGKNGRMIGGCVNPAGGLVTPCTAASSGDGPTQGVITFRAVLQDNFTNNYPSGDKSVDQGDKLTDASQINGNVLDNNTFAVRQLQDDDAQAEFTIRRDGLSKKLYAVNGDTNPAHWQRKNGEVEIKPFDTVTYRVTYDLNTSDVEDLVLEDYLPLPVFFVGDPDANDNSSHSNGPVFVFDDTKSAAAPAVGYAHFGPADTFRAYSGIVPTISRKLPQNMLGFNYGDYDNPANQSSVVDLLFTLTVSSEPFADQSFIANGVYEREGSTNNGPFVQDAWDWVILTQPVLVTKKGVIWTSSASAVLDPQSPGPVDFLGPSAAPRWNGVINSNGLAAHPINSNITGVRPGDIVSFAIVIENKGSSLAGAFDIVVQDTLPEVYAVPAGGPNLQIYYGDGTGPIAIEPGGDLFKQGIKLVDPVGRGVCQAYNPNLGNNVILITYDLQVQKNIKAGTYTNTGRISHHTSHEGGAQYLEVKDTATTSWIRAKTLAETGFAPRRVTVLPAQPPDAAYVSMPNLWLEIPTLDVKLPVIGVPNTATGWDLTWLSDQVGYLQGTTAPTAIGNTVLTAHVYLADGTPGPFINLEKLRWGQTVILHADGYRYTYEVRQNRLVSPTDLSVFKEDGYAWVTLLTCKNYSEYTHNYLYRVAVKAVLLRVQPE